jgi:type IV pilus biogenesis protein CpaD/CtpE
MRNPVFFVGVILLVSGCASMDPQTRDEYRTAVEDGRPFTMKDTFVAKRGFDEVVKTLRQKSDECLNVNIKTTRKQDGMTTMATTDEVRTTIHVVNSKRAELTMRMNPKGIIMLNKVPAGGFYRMAIDIDRLAAGSTRLTYYGSSTDHGKRRLAAIKQWSDGKQVGCPS